MKRLTLNEFIERSNIVHNFKYDYSKSKYINAKTKLQIQCPYHGVFYQTPDKHLYDKCGCALCGGSKRKTICIFIDEAHIIHNFKYDYTYSIYNNAHSKIKIICPIHGFFTQTPDAHINQKQGCPKCREAITSKLEKEWLDYLNISIRHYEITIKDKKFIVDGIKFETNTIYEFLGDYWHGNPNIYNGNHKTRNNKTMGDLYNATMERFSVIKSIGFDIVYIWESDWKNQKKNLRRNTRNFDQSFLSSRDSNIN